MAPLVAMTQGACGWVRSRRSRDSQTAVRLREGTASRSSTATKACPARSWRAAQPAGSRGAAPGARAGTSPSRSGRAPERAESTNGMRQPQGARAEPAGVCGRASRACPASRASSVLWPAPRGPTRSSRRPSSGSSSAGTVPSAPSSATRVRGMRGAGTAGARCLRNSSVNTPSSTASARGGSPAERSASGGAVVPLRTASFMCATIAERTSSRAPRYRGACMVSRARPSERYSGGCPAVRTSAAATGSGSRCGIGSHSSGSAVRGAVPVRAWPSV
ncbi:hypothetical protein B0E37_05251 [Streptomyces sp. MH192]|nr:hypothetical protein [Streptomyces sp. MH192]MCF0103467.1 hypothetical protein [Streptomyces sp. MH191]